MSVNVKVNIKNLVQVRAAFAAAPYIIGPSLHRAIVKSVLTIGRRSRELTPVDTGRLRASHRELFRPLYGETGTNVNYDIFVHEGTRYMKARPFLKNAIEETEDDLNRIFRDELQDALNKIGRLT